jgi:hypothetical protein
MDGDSTGRFREKKFLKMPCSRITKDDKLGAYQNKDLL